LTLGATNFLCVASVGFREVGLRASAFFGARCFGAAFFLTAVFRVPLLFKETLILLVLRAVAFCAITLFAFGRLALAVIALRLAPDFGEDR
jgi:hypothetical protein